MLHAGLQRALSEESQGQTSALNKNSRSGDTCNAYYHWNYQKCWPAAMKLPPPCMGKVTEQKAV